MAPTQPWRADHPLDVPTVERVVARQFPALAPVTARYLAEGWDSRVFEVDGTWLFRFPKRAQVVPSHLMERSLLPALAPHVVPLEVPRYELLGEPDEGCPYPFSAYRKIVGAQGHRVARGSIDPAVVAPVLARVLGAIHSYPIEDALERGVKLDGDTSEPSAWRLAALRRQASEYMGSLDGVAAPALVAAVRVMLAGAPPAPGSGVALVHNDLTEEHIIVDPSSGRIRGIIDWGDAAVGDRASDFAGLHHWMGAALVGHVLEHYPLRVDEGLMERARFIALCIGVFDVRWGLACAEPAAVAAGLRALELATVDLTPGPASSRAAPPVA